MTKHGMTHSDEFRTWMHMRQRCNPKYARPHEIEHYVDRGIKVCESWETSFANFYADMGPRPSPKHSIDRIDNDGHYEPGNVRWATSVEQNRNRRWCKETSNG